MEGLRIKRTPEGPSPLRKGDPEGLSFILKSVIIHIYVCVYVLSLFMSILFVHKFVCMSLPFRINFVLVFTQPWND